MIKMKARLVGARKGNKNLQKLGASIVEKAMQTLDVNGKLIESEAKRRAPVNFGQLRASGISKRERKKVLIAFTAKYAPFVEFGTRSKVQIPSELKEYAKKFQKKEPGTFNILLQSLALWAKRTGKIPQSAVWPVAMKILKEGTKAQPYLWPAFLAIKPKIIRELNKIVKNR